MARTNTGRDLQARLLCDTSADSNSASASADYTLAGTATATTSASTAAGSNVLTFSAEPTTFHIGATLSGTGVPTGAYVVSRTSTSPYTVTMSKYVTSPVVASGATITATANTVADANKAWAASSGAAINGVNGQWAGKTVVAGTRAYYSTGTVTISTTDSVTTVEGSGTTFPTGVVGGLLTVVSTSTAGQNKATYLITSRTDADTLVVKKLGSASGTAAASSTYTITYGVRHATILSNTDTTLVVDDWKEPYTNSVLATGPTDNDPFEIVTGGTPSFYIGLSTDSTNPSASDVSLAAYDDEEDVDRSELSSNGLSRALATYAHTSNTDTVTLSKTFTYTGSTSIPIRKIGVFNASKSGIMSFETKLPSTATLSASGDTLTITETITIN